MGEAWYEIDMGYWVVRLFEAVGLFTNVRTWKAGGTLRENARRLI